MLWKQVSSPLLLLLLFAAVVSAASGEWIDTLIVTSIVLASAGIGYAREYRAEVAAALLRERVKTRARVLRDGEAQLVSESCWFPATSYFCPRAGSSQRTPSCSRQPIAM